MINLVILVTLILISSFVLAKQETPLFRQLLYILMVLSLLLLQHHLILNNPIKQQETFQNSNGELTSGSSIDIPNIEPALQKIHSLYQNIQTTKIEPDTGRQLQDQSKKIMDENPTYFNKLD